eukprot:SAG11_NODE_86_length_17300_cov_11.466717_26_plen_137_part_00
MPFPRKSAASPRRRGTRNAAYIIINTILKIVLVVNLNVQICNSDLYTFFELLRARRTVPGYKVGKNQKVQAVRNELKYTYAVCYLLPKILLPSAGKLKIFFFFKSDAILYCKSELHKVSENLDIWSKKFFLEVFCR